MEPYLYKRAVTKDDIERARNLITAEYLRVGYIARGATESELSKNLFLDTTSTFLALKGDEVVGTLSIFGNREAGLPMEPDWEIEIRLLREKGKRLAEVGQFAVRHKAVHPLVPSFLGPSLGLFRLVLQHGLEASIDSFCICVHAKHERFYAALGFTSIGPQRGYGPVGVEASAGMELDLTALREGRQGVRSLLLTRLGEGKSTHA
jgi:hypothetical protein